MRRKHLSIWICVLIIMGFLSGTGLSQDTVTITGIVSDGYQIVTDKGEIYEIGANEKGDELGDMVGEKVKVTGSVTEEDETKVIMVTKYEVIEE